ncbi:unnamed protein product [Kluyveromyces dobzhanskii CBS 2104]|uniref:WGS project CCBQ000000000 data, contig 00058 n=1 Tax=Kluyveromyces dobzhanskii CBS 2104 TaxID=1427455 RepID=A0A0A8LDD3_9SACH|nr:unnamed protein product [Kluyveromyces dobzhanskii CBS 2104]
MGVSPDTLLSNEKLFDAGGSNDMQQSPMYTETVKVLALNKMCFKFFRDIGVSDFNMTDLYKPDSLRTRRLLSAVVNYARFREERMFDCDKFMSKTEFLLNQLRSKFDNYNYVQQQINKHRNDIELREGETLESLQQQNRHLEQQITRLRELQETLNIDYNAYKSRKQALLHDLEKYGFELIELEFERNKLEKHSKTDYKELNLNIEKLSVLLSTQQTNLDNLEQKHRKLRTSMATFQTLTHELYEVLQLISTDLQESHLKEANLIDIREQLLQTDQKLKNILSSGVMVKMKIVQSQLDNQKQKLYQLEQETERKQNENAETLQLLQKQYTDEVVPELHAIEEQIENDLANGTIKNYDLEILELKQDFQKETDAIDLEYSLLSAHINRYMEEMLRAMADATS